MMDRANAQGGVSSSPQPDRTIVRAARGSKLPWMVGAWLVLTSPAIGQMTAQQADGELGITVRDVETHGRLIRVPVNKSVLVDFSQPVREVRVAKPEFADVSAISPQQILITGRSFGTTQLIAWTSDEQQAVFDIAVDIELDRLLASIRTAEPRARVRANALLDAVVLTGDVPDADAAQRILEIAHVFSPQVINHMRVAGVQQVLLRCTVAEVNRSVVKQLGFNGFLAGENFRDAFALSNLDGINPTNIGVPEDFIATANMPFVVGQGGVPVTGSTTMSIGFPRVQTQVFVRALAENGLLKILAEPNLVAVNGQKASFLAGGEIPIPITTDERIKIEFKEFGVRLNFTPAILTEDRIRLHVAPEISEPDVSNSVVFSGISIPGFSTRRVETEVELGSGQTFAIGGLLNDRVTAVARRVPGLGDVPVLGALFRSVEYQRDETELIVLVTPELVAPVNPDQITMVPGANHVEPNDFELYLMGQIEGQLSEDAPVLQPRINHTWPVRPADLYGPSAAMKLRGPVGPSSGTEGS
ncbi:MAG: type II and III secretion system protein family protein [Planctomycetota bacterium]|nr:MAG: type II and III secretion system protein family protein [Planctomycetota bacterium]